MKLRIRVNSSAIVFDIEAELQKAQDSVNAFSDKNLDAIKFFAGQSQEGLNRSHKELSISSLKHLIQQRLQLPNDLQLSLDRKNVISDETVTVQQLGIVGGDSIYIHLNSPIDHSRNSAFNSTTLKAVSPVLMETDEPSVSKAECRPDNVKDETQNSAQAATAAGCCNQASHASDGCQRHDKETASQTEVCNRYLNEPMSLMEATDSSFPQILHAFFCGSTTKTPAETLIPVLHVLMLELGFSDPHKRDEFTFELPPNWRGSGRLQVDYQYTQLPGSEFKLIAVPLANLLIVSVLSKLVNGKLLKQDVKLKVKDYVKVGTLGNEKAADISQVYNGTALRRLSRLFKDHVGIPSLQFALTEMGGASLPTISVIPYEIQLRIISYLSLQHVVALSSVSHHFHSLTSDPLVWRQLYIRSFRAFKNMELSQNWKEMFKAKYEERKSLEAYRSLMYRNPIYADPRRPHTGHMFPGPIIGGSYDLYPPIPDIFGRYPGYQEPFDRSAPMFNSRPVGGSMQASGQRSALSMLTRRF